MAKQKPGRFQPGCKRGPGRPAKQKPGCKPGPGRPKKTAPTPTSEPAAPQLGDDTTLLLEATARRDVDRAWRHLLDTMPPRDVQVLAESNRRRGRYVPDWPELQSPAE